MNLKYTLFTILSLFSFASICTAKDVLCPQGIGPGPGDKPALIENVGTDSQLIVCGPPSEKRDDIQIYSEFDVYSVRGGVFSKSLLNAAAMDYYSIGKEKNGLSFEEKVFFQGKFIPAFKKSIICSQKNCILSAEKCAFIRPATFKSDALDEINKKPKVVTDRLIMDLGELALTGNREAIKVFEKNPGIKLDGAAAEEYISTKKMLARLMQLKCKL